MENQLDLAISGIHDGTVLRSKFGSSLKNFLKVLKS